MEASLNRSERPKKAKRIFSPSDPLQPYYYLIRDDGPEKYKIVGRTSIQRIQDDEALLKSGKTAKILTSGTIFDGII